MGGVTGLAACARDSDCYRPDTYVEQLGDAIHPAQQLASRHTRGAASHLSISPTSEQPRATSLDYAAHDNANQAVDRLR